MAKILVAEDSWLTSEMLAFQIESAGHEVVRALDGREALRLAASEHPDLILLDLLMPELDGLELLHHLKRDPTLEPIPVLMLSAKTHEQDVAMSLSAGADDYMTKPFNPKELLARIERLAGRG